MNILRKIATVMQLAIALLIACAVLIPQSAEAESVMPSVSMNDLYKIESGNMWLAETQKQWLYDMILVGIDPGAGHVEAVIHLPLVPENLSDVVLFDGTHVAHLSFERMDETTLRIYGGENDIATFDGTAGLFLFID